LILWHYLVSRMNVVYVTELFGYMSVDDEHLSNDAAVIWVPRWGVSLTTHFWWFFPWNTSDNLTSHKLLIGKTYSPVSLAYSFCRYSLLVGDNDTNYDSPS
jgi:hypothetical protein